jgi:hypothetical protein
MLLVNPLPRLTAPRTLRVVDPDLGAPERRLLVSRLYDRGFIVRYVYHTRSCVVCRTIAPSCSRRFSEIGEF